MGGRKRIAGTAFGAWRCVETRPSPAHVPLCLATTMPRASANWSAIQGTRSTWHVIDLERNDLGRVCIAAAVEVDELQTVESYAHGTYLSTCGAAA